MRPPSPAYLRRLIPALALRIGVLGPGPPFLRAVGSVQPITSLRSSGGKDPEDKLKATDGMTAV